MQIIKKAHEVLKTFKDLISRFICEEYKFPYMYLFNHVTYKRVQRPLVGLEFLAWHDSGYVKHV